jgi:hypothetical protein
MQDPMHLAGTTELENSGPNQPGRWANEKPLLAIKINLSPNG